MSDISTPAQVSSARMLKAVVIGLGALIVIALAFVALGIVKKFSGPGAVPASAVFSLPSGARIVEMQSEPNRLVLRVHLRDGTEEVDIIDTEDGRLVARIK